MNILIEALRCLEDRLENRIAIAHAEYDAKSLDELEPKLAKVKLLIEQLS